jgi:hypothetical protein
MICLYVITTISGNTLVLFGKITMYNLSYICKVLIVKRLKSICSEFVTKCFPIC